MSETRPPFLRRILRALLSTPLRFKITVPYLIVVIILAGFVTFFASQGFARTLREQFSSRIADAAVQVGDGFFDIESLQLSSLRTISRTEGVASAVAAGDIEQLSDLVRPIALNSQLELVDILDMEGQALLTFHQDPESSVPLYVTTEATNYEDLPLVQSVLAGEVDELGDKFAAIVSVPWGAAVYTAGPITQNNELVGVVLVGKYLDSIAADLFEQSRTGVSIYDPQGVLISSSLVGKAGTLATISTTTFNAVAEYRGERLITRTIQAGSRNYVEALTSLFIRGEPTVYVQGVALPEALLTDQSGPSPFTLVSWFLIATLSVIGLGFVIAQAIAVPVFELLSATTRVAEGDLDVKLGAETSDELGMLSRTFNTMVDELRQREFMRELFGRMVSEEVREAVLEGEVTLGGELKTVTLLFTDVRNFTTLSEQMAPTEIVQVLNSYFGIVNRAVNESGGTINRFGGDSSLAIFGAPVDLETRESAWRAINTGLRIQTELLSANAQRLREGQRPLEVGIGINTGEVVTGNIGSEERFEYTVIGDPVNTAARVQSLSSELEAGLLITKATLDALGDEVDFVIRDEGPVLLKGKKQSVAIFSVHGRKPESAALIAWREQFRSYGRDIVEAVYLKWLGYDPAIIAKLKGVRLRTVRRWLKVAEHSPGAVEKEAGFELGLEHSEIEELRGRNGESVLISPSPVASCNLPPLGSTSGPYSVPVQHIILVILVILVKTA